MKNTVKVEDQKQNILLNETLTPNNSKSIQLNENI